MRLVERSVLVAFRGIEAALAASAIPPARRRIAAYYLLVTGANCDGGVVGRVLGCSRQNISKALHQIEDLRDDPVFDAALTQLETQLFGALP